MTLPNKTERRTIVDTHRLLFGLQYGSDSHLMTFLPSLWFSNGGINACEPEFAFRRLCRVGWLLRV